MLYVRNGQKKVFGMNMNQIINMIMRIVMRKAIGSGINAGVNAASGIGRKRRQQVPQTDDSDGAAGRQQARVQDEDAPRMSREELRKMRQARRAARQARQDAKDSRRV